MIQRSPGQDDLDHWLAPLGLSHLIDAFVAQGIRPEHLPELTENDLRELGLTIGERKTFNRHRLEWARGPNALSVLPERRPLTVMFVDLADSSALSVRLEAEDLMEVLRAYRAYCDGVIGRFGGRIAQFAGDGILAYFCYPVAHENDAERAVRAGLEIGDGVRGIVTAAGVPLEVRVGIATGRVVIGNLFGGTTLDAQSVNGSTANLADRMQRMAPPDGVVVSELTHERVGSLFVCDDLGPTELKGFGATQHAFRVHRAREGDGAQGAVSARLTPMFARDGELDHLVAAWQAAVHGLGGAVLVTGEAGLGKSRLVARFAGVAGDGAGRLVRLGCSPFDQDSLFHPFLAHLRIAAGFAAADDAETRLGKLAGQMRGPGAAEDLAAIADLMQVRGDPALAGMPPAWLRERNLAALARQFLALAEDEPLCMVVEDLHWIDPSSETLVLRLAEQAEGRRMLLVLTSRTAPERLGATGVSRLELGRLTADDVANMVQSMFGDEPVPRAIVQQIVGKTDGLPLYVEEYVRPLLRTGSALDWSRVAAAEDRVTIPASLHDALMARLDRSGAAKEVAQVAAVIGRVAPRDVLAQASGLDAGTLEAALGVLHEVDLLHATAAQGRDCFAFGHALVRETAYDSLLRDRRRELHKRVARALVELDPRGVEQQPELLALHLTEAGLAHEAVEHWYSAGQRALGRSALLEAVRLLRRGLSAAEQLADAAERGDRRLQFSALLGPALLALSGPGSSEVQELYSDAYAAAEKRDETPWHFPLAWGWWRTARDYTVRAERASQLLARARRKGSLDWRLQAHHCNWAAEFVRGRLECCVEHCQEGLAIYGQGDFSHHANLYGNHDAGICAHGEMAQVRWMQGRLAESRGAEAEVQRLSGAAQHLGSRIHAMDMTLLVQGFRRDHAAVAATAEALVAFAGDHGLADHRAKAMIFRGWAACMTGETGEGIAVLRSGLERQREIGTVEDFPFYLAMLAEGLVRHGRAAEAVEELTRVRAELAAVGVEIGRPEVLRHLGVAMLAADRTAVDAAAAAFREAREAAAAQGAALPGLRVALELAGLDGDARALRAALEAVPDAAETPEHAAAEALLRRLAPRGR